VGLGHKHSNKEGRKKKHKFFNITYKSNVMVHQNKLQKYTVLEYVLNFGKQFAHYIVIYFFAIAFSITNNDYKEMCSQLIIDRRYVVL